MGAEESGVLKPHHPRRHPALLHIPNGQEAADAQGLHQAFLCLGSVTLDLGLELAFGLGPLGASDVKREMPQAPSVAETLKMLDGQEPQCERREEGGSEDIFCCDPLKPGPLVSALPIRVQVRFGPTFGGFRKLGASRIAGFGEKEIQILAVGNDIRALPAADSALLPASLLCCI